MEPKIFFSFCVFFLMMFHLFSFCLGPHPELSPAHQVIQLAYHATVKTDVPTSTVTSASKKPSQCNESLPTVATMIAKATENYGVDMRTMRNSTSTTQTILQKVLSSKEAIYSPTACR